LRRNASGIAEKNFGLNQPQRRVQIHHRVISPAQEDGTIDQHIRAVDIGARRVQPAQNAKML
jgi:hypothetical protein